MIAESGRQTRSGNPYETSRLLRQIRFEFDETRFVDRGFGDGAFGRWAKTVKLMVNPLVVEVRPLTPAKSASGSLPYLLAVTLPVCCQTTLMSWKPAAAQPRHGYAVYRQSGAGAGPRRLPNAWRPGRSDMRWRGPTSGWPTIHSGPWSARSGLRPFIANLAALCNFRAAPNSSGIAEIAGLPG